jgi:hypothetical protein
VERTIGTIVSYYGALWVKEENGSYFWGIDNYSGISWEEIPKSLYDELVKFEESRNKSA